MPVKPIVKWHFPPMPDTKRLRFEPLSVTHIDFILSLFADDSSPYIIPEYKQPDMLAEYISLISELKSSIKRGCEDWLIVRKTDNQPVGIIGVYGCSMEGYMGRNLWCQLGFCVGKKFRRKGYASESIVQICSYMQHSLKMTCLVATVHPENTPSFSLLRSLGFVENDSETTEDQLWLTKLLL